MRIYFAGLTAKNGQYAPVLREAGVERVLDSYFYVEEPHDSFRRVMVDSGGYTAQEQGEDISRKEYAKWLNEHEPDLAFNLDTPPLSRTRENQRFLDSATHSTYIIPVYHVQSWMRGNTKLLKEYVQEYPYISLGGLVTGDASHDQKTSFFRFVFRQAKDHTRVHGLGVSGNRLKEFPFYSVDSTTWVSASKYRSVARFDRKRGKIVMNDALTGKDQDPENASLEDFQVTNRYYLDCIKKSVNAFLDYEDYLQRLWTKRGVEFSEFNPQPHI